MEAFLAKAFLANRQVARDGGMDYLKVEQELVDFLNRCLKTGNVLVTDRVPWGFGYKGEIMILRRPSPGQRIFVQIIRDDRRILIDNRALRAYLGDLTATRKMVGAFKKFFRCKGAKEIHVGVRTDMEESWNGRALDLRVAKHQRAVENLIMTAGLAREE
jgi:hypothetical protein